MPYQTQLQWLVKLARLPGWKEHAWHRAKALEADQSGIWTGIKQDLIGQVKASESALPCDTKPPYPTTK